MGAGPTVAPPSAGPASGPSPAPARRPAPVLTSADSAPAAPPSNREPDSFVGRLIAARYSMGDDRGRTAHYWYVGVVVSVEPLDPIDPGDGDELPRFMIGACMEDGDWYEAELSEFHSGANGRGPLLCPVGAGGRPLRASRIGRRRNAKVAHGLVLALDRRTGGALVATARYSDSSGPAGELTLRTRTGRAFSKARLPCWGLAELPAMAWDAAVLDAQDTPRAFEELWSWICNPATAPSTPVAPAGAAAPAALPRLQIPAISRAAPMAPEADDSRVPADRKAAFAAITEYLDPLVRWGNRPEDRNCTLAGLRQGLEANRMSLAQRHRPYRPRRRYSAGPDLRQGQLLDPATDKAISDIGTILMGGKRRTVLKRRSLIEGYRQACASRQPPTAMLPLTEENVTHWWTRAWLKGLRMSRLDDSLAAVTQFAKATGFDLDQPRPGIDPFVRENLLEAKKALVDLDGSGVRRAFPITLRLLGFIQTAGLQDLDDLQDLQFWARSLAAHSAMLRAEDHCRGRPRWGDWKELPAEGPGRATWMIRPGKAHRTSMPAEFGLFNADEGGAAAMATMSGYVMALYRQRLRQAHREARGCEPRDDAFLFPEISAAGVVNWRRYANDTDFLELLRSKALESGCPPALCARLQFHGFRSGGASDWFNFGQGRHSIIQFIMRQGRWRSTAFRVYIRLRGSAVAAVMNEVFAAARREHAPDSAEGRRVMGLLTRLRNEDHQGPVFADGPME